ncbi:accessory gene regulator B family protein [Domibacillus antri]|nr:accessory gene regulator B family protein [Domibacillus antri]
MITKISRKLAVTLSTYSGRKNEVDYLRYGIEILLSGWIKVMTLLAAAYILGLFQPLVCVLFTFSFFRTLTGGHHYSTYMRCLTAGLVIMIGASYTAKWAGPFIHTQTLFILVCLSALFGLFLAYRFAPSNHFYKKCTEKQKKTLRKFAFFAIIIWFLLMYTFISIDHSKELIFASILGFVFQMGSIHPYTYKVVYKIEAVLDRR